jgi:predicted membrane metal-binding protein
MKGRKRMGHTGEKEARGRADKRRASRQEKGQQTRERKQTREPNSLQTRDGENAIGQAREGEQTRGKRETREAREAREARGKRGKRGAILTYVDSSVFLAIIKQKEASELNCYKRNRIRHSRIHMDAEDKLCRRWWFYSL